MNSVRTFKSVLHENFDQKLVNSLLGQLNIELCGLDCSVFTTSI